jgi:hypothetical protein
MTYDPSSLDVERLRAIAMVTSPCSRTVLRRGRSTSAPTSIQTGSCLARTLGAHAVAIIVFISTMSVFTDRTRWLDEDSAAAGRPTTKTSTVTPTVDSRCVCEQEAQEPMVDRSYRHRPLVIGRTTTPVDSLVGTPHRQGREGLHRDPRTARSRSIDARDQADWTVTLTEKQQAGYFNSVSPAPPFGFGDLLDATVRAVGPDDTSLTWVDPRWLLDQGETHQSLPLWNEGLQEWALAANPAKAIASGCRLGRWRRRSPTPGSGSRTSSHLSSRVGHRARPRDGTPHDMARSRALTVSRAPALRSPRPRIPERRRPAG